MYDKRIQWVYSLIDTFFSIIRVLLLTSFKKTEKNVITREKCILMATGPSLLKSVEENKQMMDKCDIICVNYMVFSPQYIEYKPNIYILCDPEYWFAKGTEKYNEKVRKFYDTIVKITTWNLHLYIPSLASKSGIDKLLSSNKNIILHYYNKTKFEGYKKLSYWIYNKQWGMPRAQNVLNAALMLAIFFKYKTIYLAGADNNWIQNMWIDEHNRLRLNDYHYYKENTFETDAIIMPIKLYEQCAAFYFTFKGYIDIEKYAHEKKVKIYNLNKNSFIDAFEKKLLYEHI